MTRRSNRLNRIIPKTHIVFTPLRDMMDVVHHAKSKRDKLKHALEVMEYIIFHFDKLKQAYVGYGSFPVFAKTTFNKFQELIDTGKIYLQEGEKIKGSLKRLQYLQTTYLTLYVAYEEQSLLENRSKILTVLMEKKQIKSDRNCKEMKKHIKKFLVNQLPLCYDVVEIIKSYIFYDVKTFAQITFTKRMKYYIVQTIDFAISSRKNGFEYEDGDPDEIEHWGFRANDDEMGLQGVNCRFCGNYWSQYTSTWTPHNILCNCEFDYYIEN